MTLPEGLDPRKHYFHSNNQPVDEKSKLEKIQKDFHKYWDPIPVMGSALFLLVLM